MLVTSLYGEDQSKWENFFVSGQKAWFTKYVGAAKNGGLLKGVDYNFDKLKEPI